MTHPDSYPYLHAARRRVIPYARCLAYVAGLEAGLNFDERSMLAEKLELSERDCLHIQEAFRNEQLRRAAVLAVEPKQLSPTREEK